ncbi:MAG TPA: lipid A deacylase LpxR family protein [Ramlibacter sp.]
MTAAGTTVRRLLCLAAVAMAAGGAGAAPTCSEEESIRPRGGTIRVENDRAAGTDQNYTSGVGLTLMSHDLAGPLRAECLPAPVRLHANLIRLVNPGFWSAADDPDRTQNVVVKFGQSMYTPGDFARTDLIRDDRPYAGLLYLGLSWNRRQPDEARRVEMLDTREVTLGVIGPLSLARQTQDLVHDVIGVERFRGWDHQLKNEPAVQLAFDRKYRGYRGQGAIIPGFSADTIRSVGVRIGNIETSGVAGVEGRVGWNLPNDFGSYPIRPGAENRPPSAAAQRTRTRVTPASPAGAHLFATLETRLVLHDFSLDGNLWRSSHSVSRRPLVLQGAIGLSVHGVLAGHGVRLALMRVKRSREFEQQGPTHSYAAVALSVDL